MHGAPIQCTRGKCSKAFHISCAHEGAEHGIVYEELGEVEKDVVLVDMAAISSLYAPMDIDANISPPQETPSDSVDAKAPNKEAIKVVKKIEFQLLCPQHNPVSVTEPNLGVPWLIARWVALTTSQKGKQTGQDSERLARPRADVKDQDSRQCRHI